MVQEMLGTKRPRWTLARALLAAAAIALSAGVAGAQDVMPVQISAQVEGSAEAVFRNLVWEPVVQAKCVNCHVAGGLSGHTRLVFEVDGDAAGHLQTFANFLVAAGVDDGNDYQHGHELILVKIQGAGHGGGEQVAADSDDFDNMDRFLALLENEAEAEAEFGDHISDPIVQARCVNCHVVGGLSGHTRLLLVKSADDDDHEATNLQAFENLVAGVVDQGGAAYILDKVQGIPSHGGGVQLTADSDDFASMTYFLTLLEEEPQGFVSRLLMALDDADTSMMFGITTPMNEDTVAGNSVAVSATKAPTEAVHFAYRPDDDSQEDFDYLGAGANYEAALYAWDTKAMADGDYELAALYTEDEGDSVTHDAVDLTVDNVDAAAAPDIVENEDSKAQALQAEAAHEVITSNGVMVTVPAGALDADDRLTIEVTDFADAAAGPGDGVGIGTVDVALDSGQSTFLEAATVALPYPEGRPDGIVHDTEIDETELSLWYFDTAADDWEMVSVSTVDGDADLVSAEVTQTGEYGIFHAPMMMMVEEDTAEPEPDTMAMAGDGAGGGGCAMLPVLPPGGGPPDDPTLIGLLGLVTAYLLFGRRRLRLQAAAV